MTLFAWQRLPKQREQVLYNCSEFDRKNDEWVSFPIGMSWQITNYPDSLDTAFLGSHEHLALCAISDHTDQRRRGHQPVNRRTILATLAKNGIQNTQVDSNTYFHVLPTYKFVISPEGNGIDCHRHYEALMAGCIPIVEDYPPMREKYGNCPILYTKDYSEITPAYLAMKYMDMLGQVWDFSRLCLDTFDKGTQRQIQLNGNYWGGQTAHKPWYLSVCPPEEPKPTICAVFVCNKAYFHKFLYTCQQLVTNGKYTGKICLVIGDDLKDDPCLQHDLLQTNKVIVKHFPTHNYPKEFMEKQISMERYFHWSQKLFQYHKLYLFDTYFKQYDYVFYLDCEITIYSDVTPMLNECKSNTLLAHSDAYPAYTWTLAHQFSQNNAYFTQLSSMYDLNKDYFQTTMMLYDTSIIETDTYQILYNLMLNYPISITNDQGIISLYFSTIRPVFQQIKTQNEMTYFYDYMSRGSGKRYIMLKKLE